MVALRKQFEERRPVAMPSPRKFAQLITRNTEALYAEKVPFAEFSATQRRLWDQVEAHGLAFSDEVTKLLVDQPTKKEPTADAAMAFLRDLDPSHPGVCHRELESVLMKSERGSTTSGKDPEMTARVFCIHEARALLQQMPADWQAQQAQKTDRWEAGDRFIGFWFDGLLGSVSSAARWREPDRFGELTHWDCGRTCPSREGATAKLEVVVLGDEPRKPRKPFKFESGMDWADVPMGEMPRLFKAGKFTALTGVEREYLASFAAGKDDRTLHEMARFARMDRLRILAMKKLMAGVR